MRACARRGDRGGLARRCGWPPGTPRRTRGSARAATGLPRSTRRPTRARTRMRTSTASSCHEPRRSRRSLLDRSPAARCCTLRAHRRASATTGVRPGHDSRMQLMPRGVVVRHDDQRGARAQDVARRATGRVGELHRLPHDARRDRERPQRGHEAVPAMPRRQQGVVGVHHLPRRAGRRCDACSHDVVSERADQRGVVFGGCHNEKKNCDPCHGIRMPHTTEFMAHAHARAAAVDLWYNGGKACGRCHTASTPSVHAVPYVVDGQGARRHLGNGRTVTEAPALQGCDSCHLQYAYHRHEGLLQGRVPLRGRDRGQPPLTPRGSTVRGISRYAHARGRLYSTHDFAAHILALDARLIQPAAVC